MRGSRIVWEFGAFWTTLNFVHFLVCDFARKIKTYSFISSQIAAKLWGRSDTACLRVVWEFWYVWSTLNFVQFSWSAVSRAKKNVALSFDLRLSPNFEGDMKRVGCGWCYILVHLGQGRFFVVCGCASAISAKISITLKVKNIPKIWGRSGTTWFWVVW